MKGRVAETGGSSGKPTTASVNMGERLHGHLVRRLVEVIDSFK